MAHHAHSVYFLFAEVLIHSLLYQLQWFVLHLHLLFRALFVGWGFHTWNNIVLFLMKQLYITNVMARDITAAQFPYSPFFGMCMCSSDSTLEDEHFPSFLYQHTQYWPTGHWKGYFLHKQGSSSFLRWTTSTQNPFDHWHPWMALCHCLEGCPQCFTWNVVHRTFLGLLSVHMVVGTSFFFLLLPLFGDLCFYYMQWAWHGQHGAKSP